MIVAVTAEATVVVVIVNVALELPAATVTLAGSVAAALLRRLNELPLSVGIVLLMMLFGAFSFYVGVDLPRRSARRSASIQRQRWSPDTVVEILSAVGIFLAAIATFASVGIIILDETVSDGMLAWTGISWMIGASFQIAAGILVRNSSTVKDAGK